MLSAVILSEHSYPAMPLAWQPEHQRFVHSGPLVLGATLLKSQTSTADRDRTVSRRSKPSSRTTLNGEQPYPWDRLQPQDVMSRHRGAKHRRRCELLGGISLLSPEYLLSVERWPFHSEPPDHYDLLSYLLDVSVSQLSCAYAIALTMPDFRPGLATPSCSSVTLWEETAPVKLPTTQCPRPGLRVWVRTSNIPGWYFKDWLHVQLASAASKPPTYPTQIGSKFTVKL